MNDIKTFINKKYEYGFITDIATEKIPSGLNSDIVKYISKKKGEPDWLLQWRLKAYKRFKELPEPTWSNLRIPNICYNDMSYYAAPIRDEDKPNTLEEIDEKILETYQKLGIPLREQEILAGINNNSQYAVDAIFDSVSVATTFRQELEKSGIIFCPISEAVLRCPELIKKYLGSVVPIGDNKHATLNSAVFSDGTFVYIPPDTRCPIELSTYFRMNAENTGQFERTLIIADKGSYVSYLEGCTAPKRDQRQLHAAVVELIALDYAEIKYSTVQNWYPGDEHGVGGIYNFVTKRGLCRGHSSKISWIQVETGSAITWKYPSCILQGDYSTGLFYSVALTRDYQQADTGTKMIHIGKNTTSSVIAKGISAGHGEQTYRGLVRVNAQANGSRHYTRCDSLLLGKNCAAHTTPYMDIYNKNSIVEHEATTSRVSENQLFYCLSRGLTEDDAISLIVNGFCVDVMKQLPMEFSVEARKLLGITLEGAIG